MEVVGEVNFALEFVLRSHRSHGSTKLQPHNFMYLGQPWAQVSVQTPDKSDKSVQTFAGSVCVSFLRVRWFPPTYLTIIPDRD